MGPWSCADGLSERECSHRCACQRNKPAVRSSNGPTVCLSHSCSQRYASFTNRREGSKELQQMGATSNPSGSDRGVGRRAERFTDLLSLSLCRAEWAPAGSGDARISSSTLTATALHGEVFADRAPACGLALGPRRVLPPRSCRRQRGSGQHDRLAHLHPDWLTPVRTRQSDFCRDSFPRTQ
jgi:hypothetical protein